MKMWKKFSLLAVITILVATGIFGSVVVYQTAIYNQNQTIEGHKHQMQATVHILEREMADNTFQEYSDTTKKSFFHFVLRRYASDDYILIRNREIFCNLTDFDVVDADMSRWKRDSVEYIVQNIDDSRILVLGKRFLNNKKEEYLLLMVKDISRIYTDLRQQVILLIIIYAGVAVVSVNIIFWITKWMLKPLNELQRTAAALSQGDFRHRVRIKKLDEVGQVGAAFNKMADRIEMQVEELEETSERRKQLLGSLTHELKTPMTSIIGYSDTLLHVNINAEQRKKSLEHINRECKRLERLSGKMMNLIGLYDNESMELERFSVAKLLKRVEALEQYHMKEAGMQLVTSCTMDTLVMDVDLMESLLINLIDNAIKASQSGDTIDVIATNNRITVRDRGKGIEPEEIPRITEAFYMVDKSRSKKAGGIGLGLALCAQIAELHHAHLEIESWLDEGTLISVVFDTREAGVENESKEDK